MNRRFDILHASLLLVLIALIIFPRILWGCAIHAEAREAVNQEQFVSASSLYLSAMKRVPFPCKLYGTAAQVFFKADNQNEAIHWFYQGEACGGLSFEDWLVFGDSFYEIGDESNAIRYWTIARTEFAASFDVYKRLGMASQKLGDLPGAIHFWQNALIISPENASAHFQLGLLLLATDPEKALPFFMKASELDPEFERTSHFIRTELNRASSSDNKSYVLTTAGRILAGLDEWDLSIVAFKLAIRENDLYAEAWAWLSEAQARTGQDGRREMEKALYLNPESASIHALDGLYWMQVGKPEKALLAFKQAAFYEPKNAIWQVSMGNTAVILGDYSSAIQYYYKGVELAPENPTTWKALASFSLDNDVDVRNTGFSASLELFRLAPEEWSSLVLLGRAENILGNRMQARVYFLKAIDLSPLEPAAHYYLAEAYLESDLKYLAYDKLLDTINLDPEGIFGWQAQRILDQYFP